MFSTLRLFSVLLALLLSLPAPGQFSTPSTGFPSTELKVRVTFTNDRPAARNIRVQLLSTAEVTMTERFTDDLGQVSISGLQPGNYRLRVTGQGLVEVTTPVFSIHRGENSHTEFVRMDSDREDEQAPGSSGGATVSALELNVPAKARKEFEKGQEAMQAAEWVEARSRLEKAIAVYPQYFSAHNNLGVVYMQMGDREKGRLAFERSLAINDQYTRAYRNLAQYELDEKDYAEAAMLLEKSLAADPLDAQAMTMLAQAQLAGGQTEQAILTARKAHSIPHEGASLAHLVAARALEHAGRANEAVEEYIAYLKEEPESKIAPRVRAALEALRKRLP